LQSPLNKVVNLVLANRVTSALMQEFISYYSNVSLRRRKSSRRLFKDTLNYSLLF
ncbi:hypothetical protein PTT_09201, partial [Pyrenophora teres f. teres 0-1]